MKSRNFLSGVGIVALAGALAAVPAHASEGESEGTVAEEASGEETPLIASAVRPVARRAEGLAGTIAPIDTFAGLKRNDFDIDFTGTVNLAIPRTGSGFVATVTGPTQEIIARDDVGSGGIIDVNNTQPSVVQIFSQRNSDGGVFFNCTGSVINPRTILTAAHCVNASGTRSSEAYGLPGTGAERTQLIATGVDTSGRLFTYLGSGAGYGEGGVASSTDVIIHSSSNPGQGGLNFPWADIALIAVDSPIVDVPSLPILLTPLTELTHVVQVGYGTFGVANGINGGGSQGIGFLRRVGENMLGALASPADLGDSLFPAFAPTSDFGFETQAYYFTDFDNPNRTQEEIDGCTFSPTGISCVSLAAVRAIDYFDDDALPNEVATAGGDSGSPLIVDQLYDFPIAVAVLSGGFDFFGVPEGYGDISFYNPIYPFFEFITENTAYKYVSAVEGDGVWSDPSRWTQDLDPGFFIDDGTGTLVNGIPTGSEPGIYEAGPKLGTIVGIDISGNSEAPSPFIPPDGTPNFGSNTPNSSALLGPGSTGFVPQNTDGTPGVAFANPAQYFEVHLNRAGTTTVDMDVEIDKLVIDNDDAGFVLPDAWDFTSLIDVEHLAGTAEIDGTLNTPIYILGEGALEGDGGTINTNVLFNVAGLMSAGGTGGFGTLTINGDYVQTSGGALWADYTVGRRRAITSDFYAVSGTAVLDGDLVVSTGDRAVRFGTEFTVLSAGAIDGDFASTFFVSRSPILTAVHSIEGGDVVVRITARSIRGLVGAASPLGSIGGALDTIRANNFDQFVGLFDIIDGATVDTLGATLSSLAPTSAFSQTFTANTFSQRFTGQIAQRTLALRGGSRAAGGFSAAGNASFALAGNTPTEAGRIGIFGSASGVFLNGGQQGGVLGNGVQGFGFDAFSSGNLASGVVGANAFEQASLTQAGEMTVGADMRVSDGFSFGVAVSEIRNSQVATSALQPQEDRSQSVAIYATYADGGLFADGYAGTSDQRFGVERAAQGDFTRAYANAIGQADGRQTFGGLRLGYAFDLAKGVEAGPVMSMDYVRNRIGGYDEIGAGAFGLSIADRTFTSMGAKAGAMASFDIRSGQNTAIRAFGSVAYARELADTQDVVTAHFFGAADTPFTISNQLDPEWVSVNAGAEMQVGANLRASISVTSDMGRGVLSNDQAQASLSWRF
ncbi:autotransporter domain-containing protein [Erythrobacter aurantius]|uniref:autotransporter domain-containing protein n=1 Tax=Erythrobacter aurantius TaxID=2909249 RepID=UPI002079CBBE|nr:autotransporter domain-containing protein [Erythrobacter aurantius]